MKLALGEEVTLPSCQLVTEQEMRQSFRSTAITVGITGSLYEAATSLHW